MRLAAVLIAAATILGSPEGAHALEHWWCKQLREPAFVMEIDRATRGIPRVMVKGRWHQNTSKEPAGYDFHARIMLGRIEHLFGIFESDDFARGYCAPANQEARRYWRKFMQQQLPLDWWSCKKGGTPIQLELNRNTGSVPRIRLRGVWHKAHDLPWGKNTSFPAWIKVAGREEHTFEFWPGGDIKDGSCHPLNAAARAHAKEYRDADEEFRLLQELRKQP